MLFGLIQFVFVDGPKNEDNTVFVEDDVIWTNTMEVMFSILFSFFISCLAVLGEPIRQIW